MKSLSGISHTGLHADKLGKSVHLIGRLCLMLLFNMFLLLCCLFIIPAKRYDYRADDSGVIWRPCSSIRVAGDDVVMALLGSSI